MRQLTWIGAGALRAVLLGVNVMQVDALNVWAPPQCGHSHWFINEWMFWGGLCRHRCWLCLWWIAHRSAAASWRSSHRLSNVPPVRLRWWLRCSVTAARLARRGCGLSLESVYAWSWSCLMRERALRARLLFLLQHRAGIYPQTDVRSPL